MKFRVTVKHQWSNLHHTTFTTTSAKEAQAQAAGYRKHGYSVTVRKVG